MVVVIMMAGEVYVHSCGQKSTWARKPDGTRRCPHCWQLGGEWSKG